MGAGTGARGMRIRLFTFRYSATLGGFDDEPLREFIRDKEAIAFREHFFVVNEVPHLACVLVWQDAVVAPADLEAAREYPKHSTTPRRRDGERTDPTDGLDERERALFNTLRELRSAKARAEGVPPYVVFTNRELVAVVRRAPDSPTALGTIDGIGAGKVERYGRELLALLKPVPAANGSAS